MIATIEMTATPHTAGHRSLYEVTGDIKDINTMLVPRTALAAPAQADEYPPLVCDYCGALTPDPWHSSGMLHGKMSKHIHSCDACAAREATQASPAEAENEIDLFVEVGLCERLDACLAAARAAQEWK